MLAIADSGSTAHFCTVTAHVLNKRVTSRPIGIANPKGTIMYSTHEADLDLPSLPLAARRVHIVPALSSSSLLSMGQLCNAGCRVTFDAQSVTVQLKNQTILTGSRDHNTGLWHLGITTATSATATPSEADTTPQSPLLHHSYASTHSATPAELVAFAHAALFHLRYPRSPKHLTAGTCHNTWDSPPKPFARTRPNPSR